MRTRPEFRRSRSWLDLGRSWDAGQPQSVMSFPALLSLEIERVVPSSFQKDERESPGTTCESRHADYEHDAEAGLEKTAPARLMFLEPAEHDAAQREETGHESNVEPMRVRGPHILPLRCKNRADFPGEFQSRLISRAGMRDRMTDYPESLFEVARTTARMTRRNSIGTSGPQESGTAPEYTRAGSSVRI